MVRAVARALDEHWRQRERGVPTLSVLSGPDPVARAEWRAWAGQTGIVSDATAPDSIVLAIAVAVRASLYAAALRRVALRAGVSCASVVRSAASDNAQFAKLLEALDSSATEECCRAALADLPFPGSPESLLRTLDELRIALPPVFLSAGIDALPAAAALTGAEPRLQLALLLDDAGALSRAPETRAKSLARAGVIDCASESEAELQAVDRGRSAQELFLFRMFQSAPDLCGVFAVNERLSLQSHVCEIDLLARRERLAIEIDGYHHFQDAEAYRRDRRKDLELQEAGYLVLRFLASDVVADLERILETTRRVLSGRRPA